MLRRDVDAPACLGLHGRITVSAVDSRWLAAARRDPAALLSPPPQAVRARESGDNVTCTAGLTVIAGSLVWAGIEDQAAALGVTTPATLTPLYGAVGSGTGTASASDTGLFAELARSTVGAGASTPATVSLDAIAAFLFFFPPPPGTWTVTEAGLFAQGTAVAGSGTLVDHYVLGTPVTCSSPDSVLLQVAFSVAGS